MTYDKQEMKPIYDFHSLEITIAIYIGGLAEVFGSIDSNTIIIWIDFVTTFGQKGDESFLLSKENFGENKK